MLIVNYQSEIPPSLSTLFSVFKELKWRPDTKSLCPSSLLGTGMGKKGEKVGHEVALDSQNLQLHA
uniref:Uncharacterized protein n=1 Tax=Fagus sylvatica TaxID=28930 RepID=A0A2N9FAR4_FAGSY